MKDTEMSFCSVRYGMAIMLHLCHLTFSAQGQSMSIAIIAMVKHTNQSNYSNISTEGYPDTTTDTEIPVYEWSPEIQGFLLSVSIIGMLITTIPSGYFAGVLGGKKIAGLSLLISSVLNLLIPLAADYGLSYLVFVKIVQGLMQGVGLGASPAFWPKWAPPLERTKLSTISLTGFTTGNFIGVLIGGFLCEYPGWPSIFYIFGGIGCVFCILWFSLVYDDPLNHPFISDNEKGYIISSMVEQVNSPSWSLPFKAIIKALPFWAIIVPTICRFWLVSNLTTSLPTLLDNMFDLNFKKNGFLSALPLITSWITMTVGSHIADFLLSKKVLKVIRVRKLFTFLGMLPPSLFILAMPYLGDIITLIFLILAMSMSGLCYSGFIIGPLDIAPRYTGFLMGLETVSTLISALISPIVTGLFIKQDAATGWKNVFFLSSAINFLGMVFYLIFGQADIQDWAKEERITHF
ncbi:putative small intestine urate exporter isoform X2 [Sminthopsis crassicaudata]|uniref:putative small intestine urate exporter isoform X2 n=1 Tax=Sminthopsis crassicaudata TaxID=9301 RepID=UPI003D68A837